MSGFEPRTLALRRQAMLRPRSINSAYRPLPRQAASTLISAVAQSYFECLGRGFESRPPLVAVAQVVRAKPLQRLRAYLPDQILGTEAGVVGQHSFDPLQNRGCLLVTLLPPVPNGRMP